MGTTTTKASGPRSSPRAGISPRARHLRVVPPLPDLTGPPVGTAPSSRETPPPRAAVVAGRRRLATRLDLDGLRLTARGRFVAAVAMAAPLVWGVTAVGQMT